MRTVPRGFSLIELFIVVAIFGVIAAIALPSISAMAEKRAAFVEVDKVKHALDEIRDLARSRLRCQRVTKLSAAAFRVEELASAATGCGATVTTTDTTSFVFNARAVEITTFPTLTFDRTGAVVSSTAPFVDVVITGKRTGATEPRVFRIYRLLGLVRKL